MSIKRTLASALGLVLSVTLVRAQSPPLLPLAQVRPGMKGVGKTVFSGSQVEEFGVEVVDIIRNYYPQQDLILVRLHGERIDYTGVAAGMSGSPVYLEGKLVGALALRVGSFTKEALAGVTPIEQMVSLIDKEKDRAWEEMSSGSSWNPYLDFALGVGRDDRQQGDLWEEVFSTRSFNSGLPVPVAFSGFRREVVDWAGERLAQWGFVAVQGGSSSSDGPGGPVALQPGDAVSQVLIDGDMGIDVAGTVTWCRGDTVLAFGHQVFGVGAVRLPMGQTRVLATVPSLLGSDKVTTVSRIIGTIRQDRLSGLFGIVGEVPPMIPVYIRYRSLSGQVQEYHFRVAVARQLDTVIPFYLRIAVLNALLTSRLGGGDVSLKAEGQISLADGKKVRLDNFFTGTRTAGCFSPSSDAVQAADD
ncbi:MAG: SpoIVB peptidase S55 domain-containing protein, partial [Candidatus Oleimicrobiaceae bacterium]